MKNPPEAVHIERRLAPTALMLGNFVIGTSVLAPAGMLGELSSGLGVAIRDAGLLITFGGIELCIGLPVTAWVARRVERRTLMDAALAVTGLRETAPAHAPPFSRLPGLRRC